MDIQLQSDTSSLVSYEERQFIVHHVHAFVNEKEEYGNPAGVVVIDDKNEFPLKNETMINVARQVGYPETAFLQLRTDDKKSSFDVDVRFATPVSANGFCGHATVATFGFLVNRKLISNNAVYKMRTTVLAKESSDPVLAIMSIKCSHNFIEMEQNLPIFYEVDDVELITEKVAKSLNLPLSLIDHVEIVNTGGKDAIISLKEKEALDNVKLTDDICKMISEVSQIYQIVGYHLFPLDGVFHDTNLSPHGIINVTVKGVRNFAPLEGIPEEPATGSACGATACFIVKNIILPSFQKMKEIDLDDKIRVNIAFEQGKVFGCPSIIYADVLYDRKIDAFISVKVSGRSKEEPNKQSFVIIK